MNTNKLVIEKARLPDCPKITGLVVVIDVIRAFTTAAYAFAAGAHEIILTSEIEEARDIHSAHPHTLLAGELQGLPIAGFHLGNSPAEIEQKNLTGKTLVFRTSSGTQGVVKSTQASKILVSSFAVAQATLSRIKELAPEKVTFVITGQKNHGVEDVALADYLEAKLFQPNVDPTPYIERVRKSFSGLIFASGQLPQFCNEDLEACCQVDKFDFAMETFRENGISVLRSVDKRGEPIIPISTLRKVSRTGVYGIAVRDGKILLALKKMGGYKGLLDLPGGGIEFGESPEMALRREFREEVAMKYEAHKFVGNCVHNQSFYNVDDPFLFHQLGMLYSVDNLQTIEHVLAEEEFGWYSLAQIDQNNLTPFAKKAVQLQVKC